MPLKFCTDIKPIHELAFGTNGLPAHAHLAVIRALEGQAGILHIGIEDGQTTAYVVHRGELLKFA